MTDWQRESPMGEQVSNRPGRGLGFVVAMVALGLTLGFALGVFSSGGSNGSGASPLYDQELVTSLFERASPAVVEISVSRSRNGATLPGSDAGSGFLVDRDGHIITNHHVVDGDGDISVTFSSGKTVKASKLGTSPADDLALLKVDAAEVDGIEPLALADSNDVKTGQLAIAIGNPFRNFNSVTVGVVSGTGRAPTSILRRPIPDMIQTDAPLNPGNSGGPLLNSEGEVIGVNSSVRTGTFQGVGEYRIGFAVASNTVSDLMPQLMGPGIQVRRPWLGVSGGPVTADLAETLGVSSGVYVAQVFPDSPAHQAALVPFQNLRGSGSGDVITAVDGRPIGSVEDMVSHFNKLGPGSTIMLSVFREGRPMEVEVTLAEWPDT